MFADKSAALQRIHQEYSTKPRSRYLLDSLHDLIGTADLLSRRTRGRCTQPRDVDHFRLTLGHQSPASVIFPNQLLSNDATRRKWNGKPPLARRPWPGRTSSGRRSARSAPPLPACGAVLIIVVSVAASASLSPAWLRSPRRAAVSAASDGGARGRFEETKYEPQEKETQP
jgi:hypothetical protein